MRVHQIKDGRSGCRSITNCHPLRDSAGNRKSFVERLSLCRLQLVEAPKAPKKKAVAAGAAGAAAAPGAAGASAAAKARPPQTQLVLSHHSGALALGATEPGLNQTGQSEAYFGHRPRRVALRAVAWGRRGGAGGGRANESGLLEWVATGGVAGLDESFHSSMSAMPGSGERLW